MQVFFLEATTWVLIPPCLCSGRVLLIISLCQPRHTFVFNSVFPPLASTDLRVPDMSTCRI